MDESLIREQEAQLQKTGRYYKHICFMAVPVLCMACFLYGVRPLLLCGIAVLTGNLCDRLVSLLRRRVYQGSDFSNESFALVIALLMPVTVDIYVLIAAVLAGVLIGKEIFGGYGSYPFNPAAVGYVVAAVSWPEQVFRYPQPYTSIPLWDASMVPVKDKAKAYPAQLSGGQQQRVAIARALATNPKVLLCDEATSALDPKTTRQILELIGDINKKLGITVVIITHQMSVVKEVCNHVAILDDGEVVEEGLVSAVFSAPKSAAARHLVFPRGADIDVSDPQQQRRIRLIFRSAKTTSIPLVARLATEEGISATVISATTQKLSEEVYGGMLLGVPNAQFEQAMDFLRSIENLQVEEASVDVQ